MWLILTEPYDDTGAWLAQGLRPYAPGPVIHLTTRDIAQGASTAHGLENGSAWFQVRLADGATIDSRTLRGVVNRVCALPPGLACRLRSPQRDCAERNFGLPLLHLLHHFDGPVLNRPTAHGISGDFRLDFEWAALASQVGLTRTPSRPVWSTAPASRAGPDVASLAVIAEHVVSLPAGAVEVPAHVVICCRRLAALSRTSLLGLDLTRSVEGSWHFLRANPRPNLIPGGDPLLEAVAHSLSTTTPRAAAALHHPLATTQRASASPTFVTP